ncbi:MAG: hypothetical protein DRG87_09585 [Deltaproteobacteria bacterium]|nr:MAG: hypothetical protein DRG87_09585 [Deltaproteobacteria bacterium]
MAATESIPDDGDLKVFLEAAVEYVKTIDSKTGRPEKGNREAKQALNSCKNVTGILPFETDIAYNITRIEKILQYLDPRIRNKHTLHDLLNRARRELKLYHEQGAGVHPLDQKALGGQEMEVPLTTREVLKGRYADFRDIFRDAVESIRSQVQSEVSSEIFEDRFNRMRERIKEEFTGGIDGLKIYFDAKHSELLYASQGRPAEEQRDFLLRAAKTFIGAFVRNNFYELYKRISPRPKEDVNAFVFRLAKKYTDIKAIKPGAGITTYQDGEGNIQLKEK